MGISSILEQYQMGSVEEVIDKLVDGLVIVNKEGKAVYVSPSYMDIHNVDANAIGKHITDIVGNTRMHIVAKNGIAEKDELQFINGKDAMVSRIPLFSKNGEPNGAMGFIHFHSPDQIKKLNKRIDSLNSRLSKVQELKKIHCNTQYTFDDIVANTPATKMCKRMAMRAAESDATVLLLGESGVGKEVFAHSIHNASSRANGPFIRINCSAIQEELFESELFGYEEGAFTGARRGGKKGKFELAHTGTILLDEIGDMPLSTQVKLLRVVQEQEIEPLGSEKRIKVDVRIIAATNQNLKEFTQTGAFRKDLFYRLNVIAIRIPPLRERQAEIPLLARSIWHRLSLQHGIYHRRLSRATLRLFQQLPWKGNVRELQNVLERCMVLSENDVIEPQDLGNILASSEDSMNGSTAPKENAVAPPVQPLEKAVEQTERAVIANTLKLCSQNRSQAARLLQISRPLLYKKINQYGI